MDTSPTRPDEKVPDAPKTPPAPLLPLSIAFICGIVLADSRLINSPATLLLLAGLVVAFGILYLVNRLKGIRIIIVLLICLCAGVLRSIQFNELPPDDIAHLQADDVIMRVKGTVVTEPWLTTEDGGRKSETGSQTEEERDTYSRRLRGAFVISAETVSIPTRPDKETSITGLIRVSFSDFVPEVKYGDRVEILGLIDEPRSPTNPGQFDYRRYLARQQIYKIISLKKPEDLKIVASSGGFPVGLIYNIRRSLSTAIEKDFTGDEAGMLKALLLGERADVSQPVNDKFLKSGTIHILSVSGLHIAMVIGIFWWLLGLLAVSGRLRSIVLILITILYATLTGFSTPVVRSGLMTIIFLAAELFRRKSNSINSLAFAALLILIVNPNELFSIGFQLSFISVLAIIIFYKEIIRLFPEKEEAWKAIIPKTFPERAWHWSKPFPLRAIAVSLSAWFGTGPIIIQQFHLVTPVVVLANLIIAPLVFLILAVGIVYLPLAALGIGFILATPLAFLVQATIGVVDIGTKIPAAYFYLPDISLWLVAAYYLIAGLWFIRPYLPDMLNKKYLLGLSVGVLLVLIGWIIIVLVPLGFSRPDELRLTMLDLHTGSSFILELPDGKVVVYDAGTMGDYDVGKGVIAPYLWSRGISRIDTLILSHAHADHINGVPSLLERFAVREVWVSEWFEQVDAGRQLMDLGRQRGVSVKRVGKGKEIMFSDSVNVRILGPLSFDEVEKHNRAFTENDSSMVLQIQYNDHSLLLTGDIEKAAIGWLLSEGKEDLKSTVMQVPHHGYQNSLSIDLIEAVRPRYALLNAGEEFSEEVVPVYQNFGTQVLSSYQDGAITIRLSPEGHIRMEHSLNPSAH